MVVGLGFVEANPFVDSTQTKVYGANTKVLSKDLDAWIQLIRQNRSSECTVTVYICIALCHASSSPSRYGAISGILHFLHR